MGCPISAKIKGNWLWKSYDILSNFFAPGVSNGKDIYQRINFTDHECSMFAPCLYKTLFRVHLMLLLDPCTHELFAVNASQRFTTRYLLKIQNWVIFLPFQLTNLFYFLAVLEILITKANKNIVKQRFCLLRHFLHVQLHCNFSNHLILLVVYFDWHDLLYIDYTRGCHPEKTTVDRGKAEIDNGWFSIR